MSDAAGTGVRVVRRVRAAVASWQDPVARYARELRRAHAAVRHRAVATAALAGATAVAIPLGGGPGPWDLVWAAATAGVATATGFAVSRTRELERSGPPAPPPERSSAARPALNRVVAARRALEDSLARLGPLARDTRSDAVAAERTLREIAGRVAAVEAALAIAPMEARDGLLEARQVLLNQLDAGVGAYERLVVAAAECVAAAGTGTVNSFALHRLEEACDALAGLASGLRDLRASGV